jgi:hypothetical protein
MILSGEDTKEDAIKLAIIQSAPDTAPVSGNYPNAIAFLRAQNAYKLKQQYLAQISTISTINESEI